MSAIKDPPNVYDFGLGFNYTNWVQGTRLSLVNVPWNNDYRDIVKFADRAALNAYIDAKEVIGTKVENLSRVRMGAPIRIDLPFNSVQQFNYLRARNPIQPIPGDMAKDYYYFIVGVNDIAPNTTEIVVQLDVWQTFGYDITFGNGYIERGHIGIANENATDNFGRDWLTEPEGLEFGGEYRVIAKRHETVMTAGNIPLNGGGAAADGQHSILVVSTVDLITSGGTVTAPILKAANGASFEGLASGAEIYLFANTTAFRAYMQSMTDKPWVTQGIISITLIPRLTRYQPSYNPPTVGNPLHFMSEVSTFIPTPIKHELFEDWRNSPEILEAIPERYRHLLKFLTHPYMSIEMTTWTGAPVNVKPESWADPDATIVERATFTAPSQRVEFFPRRYNASSVDTPIDNVGHITNPNLLDAWEEMGDDGGDYTAIAVRIASFPTMALVNNGAINYMASNNSMIAYQRGSADWSQQRAMAGNQLSYDQQSAAIEASRQGNALDRAGMAGMTASDQLAMLEGTAASGALGMIGGLIGGIGGGAKGLGGAAANGTLGMMSGAINSGISMDASNRGLATRSAVSQGQNNLANNQAMMLRDTNKGLADWAAKGDYANNIAGINAKVQDAQLTQPSVSGQIGGETMNIVNKNVEVSLRWKLVDNAALRRVGEYWLRYGYAVRKFAKLPPSLMVMSKFTYWKLAETYITAAPMPETFKQSIRGIFEKGVTVWANPDDIGNIDIADNAPLPGVTL